jgi:hypothetical protein
MLWYWTMMCATTGELRNHLSACTKRVEDCETCLKFRIFCDQKLEEKDKQWQTISKNQTQ